MKKFVIFFAIFLAMGLASSARAEDLPDLHIFYSYFNSAGNRFTVNFSNRGKAPAIFLRTHSDISLLCYSSDTYDERRQTYQGCPGSKELSRFNDSLAPGASMTVTFDSFGENVRGVKASISLMGLPENGVSVTAREENKANNISDFFNRSSGDPKPDLHIQAEDISFSSALSADTPTIPTVSIYNRGRAPAIFGDTESKIEIRCDGRYREEMGCHQIKYLRDIQDSLAPNARVNVTFDAISDSQAMKLGARVELLTSRSYFAEEDGATGNNSAEQFIPHLRPDFKVDSIIFNPRTTAPTVTISNIGAAPGNFRNPRSSFVVRCLDSNEREVGSSSEGCYERIYFDTRQDSLAVGESMAIALDPPRNDRAVTLQIDIISTEESPNATSNNHLRVAILRYPIVELGNCSNWENCRTFCEQPENAEPCAEFGVRQGLLTAEEAQALRDMAALIGPGGCTSKENCAAFCGVPANIEACLNYAEQNNWMTADDLSKARKVAGVLEAGGTTPGGCNTPTTCKTYCSDNSHAVECVDFGKSAGLLTDKEAAEAEKVAPLMQSGQMPGGKTNRDDLEAYCETHREECDTFFERVGVKKGGGGSEDRDAPNMLKDAGGAPKTGPGGCATKAECEAYCDSHPGDKKCGEGAKDAKKTIFKNESGESVAGPGGCKTKAECDAYCDAHPGECNAAVQQAGGEVKEATATCSTREECEAFCNDPANRENAACASGTIMIKKDETPKEPTEGQASPIDQLRNDIKAMTPSEQDCVRQKIGAEVFDKFVVAGGLPEKPLRREDIQTCMSSPQQSSSLERKGFSSVLASIVNVLFGWLKP